jgi:hypothetical protein
MDLCAWKKTTLRPPVSAIASYGKQRLKATLRYTADPFRGRGSRCIGSRGDRVERVWKARRNKRIRRRAVGVQHRNDQRAAVAFTAK